jgi:hypothetical protein
MKVTRLAVGVDRNLVEHVRRVLDRLDRRYSLRASLGGDRGIQEQEDARRVREFAASLPAPPSRFQHLWPIVGVLIAVQLLLISPAPRWLLDLRNGYFDSRYFGSDLEQADKLKHSLQQLVSLSPTSVSEVFDLLLHTNVVATALITIFLFVGAWLVLRPLASGVRLARGLRDYRTALMYRVRGERLQALAERLNVREHELKVFSELGVDPVGEPRFDLAIRALLPVASLLASFAIWTSYVRGEVRGVFEDRGGGADLGTAVGGPDLGTAAVTRGLWFPALLAVIVLASFGALCLVPLAAELARRPRTRLLGAHARARLRLTGRTRRSARIAWAALPVGLVLLAFGGYGAFDRNSPSVEVSVFALTGARSTPTRPRIAVIARCSEPCHIADVQFVDLAPGSLPVDNDAPSWVALDHARLKRFASLQNKDLHRCTAPRPPNDAAWPTLIGERMEVLRLNLRSLHQQGLDFSVADRAGNTTLVPWGLWAGSCGKAE